MHFREDLNAGVMFRQQTK